METGIRQPTGADEPQDTGIVRCSLYVAGRSTVSVQAMDNLARIQSHLDLPLDVRIIDIRQQPDAAIRDQILCAPTLIVHRPRDEARLIGNLSDVDTVLDALGHDASAWDGRPSVSLPMRDEDTATATDSETESANANEYLRRRVAELERTLVSIRRSQLLALWADDSAVGHSARGPESDRVYRDLVESLPAGLLLLSAEQTVLYANQAGARLFDRSREGIVGMRLADMVANSTIEALERIGQGESARITLADADCNTWTRESQVSVFPVDVRPFSIRCLLFVDIGRVHEPTNLRSTGERVESAVLIDAPARGTEDGGLPTGSANDGASSPDAMMLASARIVDRPRVLFVDASADTTQALTTLAKRRGYEATSVATEADALDTVRDERPDVVCLDPRLISEASDGLLASLRGDTGGQPVRLIALSGGAFERPVRSNFDLCLVKPVASRELFDHIEALLAAPVDLG